MLMNIVKVRRSISKRCCVSSKGDVLTEVFKALCVCFSFNLFSDSIGQDYSSQLIGEEPG